MSKIYINTELGTENAVPVVATTTLSTQTFFIKMVLGAENCNGDQIVKLVSLKHIGEKNNV